MTKFGTGPGWKRVQRPLATALLCGAMLTSLTGCIELMVGGVVMGGVAAADRRTLGAQTEDKSIALKGESRIPPSSATWATSTSPASTAASC